MKNLKIPTYIQILIVSNISLIYLTNIDSKFEDLKETIENTSNLSGRIQPVEKGIILIGALELQSGILDPHVTINECVELSKHFGSEDGYKFINGVLDSIKSKL